MTKQKIGRLALRHEGDMWVAYYALTDSMKGALLLGSIAMRAVVGNPQRKQAFMDMMRDFVGELIQEKLGQEVVWKEPVIAPESERSGHG